MYEFAGAGPCPFPGQLQYRVVNPRGAGVYFDKTFTSPISSTLRVGQVVCGTPRTDPSGMSSYVVELGNGFANALDFEQLTSAAPAPVLASGALYQLDYVGAGPCPYPGQLQYRVVNPRGAGVFFDKSFQSPAGPTLRAGQIVCGTPRTDPSGMSSYVVELGNGFANALDFEQLTSAVPAPVLASGYYAGDVSSLGQPHLMPATGCPVGTSWSDYYGKCIPTIPPPPAPLPLTSGGYVGQGGDISPDLYGADAALKGCSPGTYWDGWYQKCLPSARRPINPPSPPPLPPTLDDWRKQHVTGWDLFNDVFDERDPFHNQWQERRWEHHHPWREHERHYVGADVAEFVGAAVSDGVAAADNAAVQADSAQLAASHPDAKGTTAAQSAQAAATHATKAASHAQAAATHPLPEAAVAHAQKANQHAQQAAAHAANAHVACGNFTAVGAYYAGADAGAPHQPPAAKAAAHADNAAKQASSAKAAASQPEAKKNPAAHQAAQASASHATQAQKHAEAARSHPSSHGAEHHAREAMKHTNAAAAHAIRAHGEARGRGRGHEGFGRGRGHEGFGRGREGFGRGRGGFRGRGFGGYRDAYGRFRGRRFHAEWRGNGHPAWRFGIGERWQHHRADCFMHGGWACLMERIYEPGGNVCYRVTPAGEMEDVQFTPEQEQANVIYVQATGEQPPTNDDGPLPGSDQTSDGSNAPADDAGEQSDADQGADGGLDAVVVDDTVTDQTSGDFTGWQMPFTDPYGYFNMGVSPAWDSAYPYLPPDYWGMGWW